MVSFGWLRPFQIAVPVLLIMVRHILFWEFSQKYAILWVLTFHHFCWDFGPEYYQQSSLSRYFPDWYSHKETLAEIVNPLKIFDSSLKMRLNGNHVQIYSLGISVQETNRFHTCLKWKKTVGHIHVLGFFISTDRKESCRLNYTPNILV